MHQPTDLVPLLEQALARVQCDPRRVWCKLSTNFESRVHAADQLERLAFVQGLLAERS